MRYRFTAGVLAVLALFMGGCASAAEAPAVPAAVTQPSAEPVTETAPAPAAETAPAPTAETEPQQERFLLAFVGDCTLGANPETWYTDYGFIRTVGEDCSYPFRNVADYFENDDFTMVNLEGALCDGGYPVNKTFTFRGPTDYVRILSENSVEAVTLANNHSMDYGSAGYASTVETLETAGVSYVEANGTALVTTESGLTVGLLGVCFSFPAREELSARIAGLREQGADIVVCAVHWGIESSYQPLSTQVEQAHAAIDAGVDIVYGSHPHVLQPIEEYNGGIIYYSLGNFCFGGNTSPSDMDTVVLQQEVIRDAGGSVTLGALSVIPARVSSITQWNNYQPTPYEAGSEDYDRVFGKLMLSPADSGVPEAS